MYPNLKLQLWKTGMRQNRLARILNVDEAILSKIVNGFREPPEQMRRDIAALLQCHADWLFEKDEPHPPKNIIGTDPTKDGICH